MLKIGKEADLKNISAEPSEIPENFRAYAAGGKI